MNPNIVYYEEDALNYMLGKTLYKKFETAKWIKIENHNNIPELRKNQNCEFARMKQNLVIGIRKTHKYVPNSKTSDFLVPYTSSGCSAMCLYCYLVCNYNKCSYLRLFVNREKMLDKLIKTTNQSDKELTFEIGSNSDLVLENTITGNLEWTIEKFEKNERGYITLPTKFDMVDTLLNLEHKGRTTIRMSVNPQDIINKVEFGTSSLINRIKALNRLKEAGYKVGILVAPVILLENWEALYKELLNTLSDVCVNLKVPLILIQKFPSI
ncbi:MAG: radical SAM protein [Anaerovoracaceae bacterium]